MLALDEFTILLACFKSCALGCIMQGLKQKRKLEKMRVGVAGAAGWSCLLLPSLLHLPVSWRRVK